MRILEMNIVAGHRMHKKVEGKHRHSKEGREAQPQSPMTWDPPLQQCAADVPARYRAGRP